MIERLTVMFEQFGKAMFQKISSNARQGKAFETMVRASLKRLSEETSDVWFQRLWDFKSFIRVNPNFKVMKQPADFLACVKGKFILIECKSSQANRFDPANIRPHQLEAMKTVERAGGEYWLVILHRMDENSENAVFAFNRKNWNALLRDHEKEQFQTLSWNELEEHATHKLQRKHGVWDLKPMLGL